MEEFLSSLGEYKVEISIAAALVTVVVELVFKPIRWFLGRFKKPEPIKLDDDTIEKIAPKRAEDGPQLTVPEFIRLRRELKADLEEELSKAHEEEKSQLRARIAALEEQIRDPEAALAEERKRIAELEALLERSSNQIGSERIDEARAALERGDYSLADEIFAEVEAARELEVLEAARAAFGRGEIAEAKIRWADAAEHYARAARLDGSFYNLFKAHEFAWRSGDFQMSESFGRELLRVAEREDNPERRSTALNELGLTLGAQGRFQEAEDIYRKGVEIDKATIGEGHPEYAKHISNLAGAVEDQGRFEDAEGLYREAIEIDKATIGAEHPEYAIRLNNLAGVVKAQGRFEEAEGLYREAIEIDKATIGERHPEYAKHTNNLASVVEDRGRFEEAEALYRQAIEIAEERLGVEHPGTKTVHGNLDRLLKKMEDDG